MTLGDIARAHHVAPRTVLRWIEEGFPESFVQRLRTQMLEEHVMPIDAVAFSIKK